MAARPRLTVPEAIGAFSSPYSLKVRKQVAQHRREEVDVDTGARRSWVEEEEMEVMDLTGETPTKAVRRRLLPCTPLKAGGRSVQPQVGGWISPKCPEGPIVITQELETAVLVDSPDLAAPAGDLAGQRGVQYSAGAEGERRRVEEEWRREEAENEKEFNSGRSASSPDLTASPR
jgi:hypothetical protein